MYLSWYNIFVRLRERGKHEMKRYIIKNKLSKHKVKEIKAFAIVTGACLAIAVFISVGSVATGIAVGYRGLPKEQVEKLCEEEGIAPSLVYATRYAGQVINDKKLIHELGEYAAKADTDEEMDVQDALVKILGCKKATAEYIVRTSDMMQVAEDYENNTSEEME